MSTNMVPKTGESVVFSEKHTAANFVIDKSPLTQYDGIEKGKGVEKPGRSSLISTITPACYSDRINSDWKKLRCFAMQLFPAGYAER